MCGICGELRFDGIPPKRDTLSKMMECLAKRGPDKAGQVIHGPIGLGHRRLAVIDLSQRADQPMLDETGDLTIVFNGTIYNYQALRHQLIQYNHRFQSTSDTEVILKAYAQWGESCITHLHGMFAFTIWDKTQQHLFLARDRLGIKPLYYSQTAHCLRFASTLPALLATGEIDKTLDPIALHHHLTLHASVPAPYTLLKGVRKIAPATTLTISHSGQVRTNTYWQLTARRPETPRTEAEWIEETQEQLQTVVNSHRIASDVPVGILLSGGLDSSLLVALMAKTVDPKNILTFSIGFEDTPEETGNEFNYSDQVATHYQTQHHRYLIPNEQVLSRLPEAITAMSEPVVGQDATAFYLLAEAVAKEVKVVQSGQGADELFGGYFWYPLMEATQGSDITRFRTHYFDRSHQEYLETITPDYQGEDYTTTTIARLLSRAEADTFLDKVLHIDITTLIVDDPIKRVDNMMMSCGIEARLPFLDHQLIEKVARMPPALKLKQQGKYPLKAIGRDLLPPGVVDREKGYFPLPGLKYVRGAFLSYMRQTLTSPKCQQRGLFQRAYINKLLSAPTHYLTPLQGNKLWHLALLESWLQIHVDQA